MVPKVSVYTAPVKSRLLLVLFGLPPKVPKDQTEIMSDLRNQQSRHAPNLFTSSNTSKIQDNLMVECFGFSFVDSFLFCFVF